MQILIGTDQTLRQLACRLLPDEEVLHEIRIERFLNALHAFGVAVEVIAHDNPSIDDAIEDKDKVLDGPSNAVRVDIDYGLVGDTQILLQAIAQQIDLLEIRAL